MSGLRGVSTCSVNLLLDQKQAREPCISETVLLTYVPDTLTCCDFSGSSMCVCVCLCACMLDNVRLGLGRRH